MRHLAATRKHPSAAPLLLAASLLVPVAGRAEDAGAADPQHTPASEGPTQRDPRPAHIAALLAGDLDVAVAPQSLFDVPLDHPDAVRIEALRLRALLEALDGDEQVRTVPRERASTRAPKRKDAGALSVEIAALKPEEWRARVELDRARLAFYSLPLAQRAEILEAHRARQEASKQRETEEEHAARAAELEREHALALARAARSEAERLVAEEVARLIALQVRVDTARARLRDRRAELAQRHDALLGWQRRVRDAKQYGTEQADAMYAALRRALHSARNELSAALQALRSASSALPELGADPLIDIPHDVPSSAARARRRSVARAITQAREEEDALRDARALALLHEITGLNRERLDLLGHLSPEKRDAVTGFTEQGLDQARAEARHLSLILRYHHVVARRYLASLRRGGPSGLSALGGVAIVGPLLLLALAFRWFRERTPRVLHALEQRAAEVDRAERRTSPGPQRRALRFAAKVHRPFEWALLFAAVLGFLPDGARGLLEVQLLSTIIGWILGGALVVRIINAAAAGASASHRHDDATIAALRLRSLSLVGRTVVAFALILALSTRLVGEGTIYSWVFSTCWFAAFPVFLLLVSWWRGVVFERMQHVRRKSRLQTWILAHGSGFQSFLAATVGAVQLFFLGATKAVRGRLARFDLARRVHAYLFKRELDRLSEANKSALRSPLRAEAAEALHPERPYARFISSANEELLDRLVRLVEGCLGGVVALIGARGMGKSSLLRALEERVGPAAHVEVTSDLGVSQAAARAEEAGARSGALVIVDDAHRLVKPVIGGLAPFDRLIALARANCSRTTWVVAIDAAVWPFLRRARDARPLFDDTLVLRPWDEEQIGALLAERCQHAGIAPAYDDLLDELSPGADELDRLEALRDKRAGYERMLWDHVRGNPALALEAFRSSLSQDASGEVRVRSLQVPDSSRLDTLPDASLFVLRAVLQLSPAAVDEVAQATRLSHDQVLNAFHFGQKQGFFVEHEGRVRVTWPWLRAVMRLLERRHLLVNT